MRLAQNTPVRAWYVKPCINQYRADWLKNCAMRDYIKSIRTNWIWCTRYILPRQQLQRQNTRIELTTKAKRADFLKLKKFLWEKKTEKENDLDMWSGYHLTNLCNTKSRNAWSWNVLQAHYRRVSFRFLS